MQKIIDTGIRDKIVRKWIGIGGEGCQDGTGSIKVIDLDTVSSLFFMLIAFGLVACIVFLIEFAVSLLCRASK